MDEFIRREYRYQLGLYNYKKGRNTKDFFRVILLMLWTEDRLDEYLYVAELILRRFRNGL